MDKRLLAVAISGLVALGALAWGHVASGQPDQGERLFFALEIQDQDGVVAQPKLLGDAGREIRMNLVNPTHPDESRLSLELLPEKNGGAYRVQLKLTLPGKLDHAEGELALAHGEERDLKLGQNGPPVSVKVMLMRVDSPEFQTYMELARRRIAESAS